MHKVPGYHQSRLVEFFRHTFYKKLLLRERIDEKISKEIQKNPNWMDKEILAMEQDSIFSLNEETRQRERFHTVLIKLAISQANFHAKKTHVLNRGPNQTRAAREKLIKDMQTHVRRRNRARGWAARLREGTDAESAYIQEGDALDPDYHSVTARTKQDS